MLSRFWMRHSLFTPSSVPGLLEFFQRGFRMHRCAPSPHPRRCKSGADLKAFGGRYAQHSFCQVCFELVENRLAEPRCNAARNALNHTADRVAFIANSLDQRYHPFRCRSVRTADDILSQRLSPSQWNDQSLQRCPELASHRRQARNPDTTFDKIFLAISARGHAANRFARRRATAALPVSDSVLAS